MVIHVNSEETNLYFLKSRYHNPEVGRFISPDTGRTGVKVILTAFDKYGTSACYQKYLTYVEVELQILLQNLFLKTLQKVH